MKIPHPVNSVLDWWSRTVWWPAVHNPGLAVSVLALAASFVARPVLPSLTWPLMFVAVGVFVGWFAHSPAIWQLQDELHVAQQDANRLRDDNRVLMQGRRPEDAVTTVHLPWIGDGR